MDDRDINEAIVSMEEHGYLFESELCGSIGFWSPYDENEDRKYLKFGSWEEVRNFSRNA